MGWGREGSLNGGDFLTYKVTINMSRKILRNELSLLLSVSPRSLNGVVTACSFRCVVSVKYLFVTRKWGSCSVNHTIHALFEYNLTWITKQTLMLLDTKKRFFSPVEQFWQNLVLVLCMGAHPNIVLLGVLYEVRRNSSCGGHARPSVLASEAKPFLGFSWNSVFMKILF